MVRNSNRDSEFSSKKFTDSLQTESSCAIYRHMMILPLPKHHRMSMRISARSSAK